MKRNKSQMQSERGSRGRRSRWRRTERSKRRQGNADMQGGIRLNGIPGKWTRGFCRVGTALWTNYANLSYQLNTSRMVGNFGEQIPRVRPADTLNPRGQKSREFPRHPLAAGSKTGGLRGTSRRESSQRVGVVRGHCSETKARPQRNRKGGTKSTVHATKRPRQEKNSERISGHRERPRGAGTRHREACKAQQRLGTSASNVVRLFGAMRPFRASALPGGEPQGLGGKRLLL